MDTTNAVDGDGTHSANTPDDMVRELTRKQQDLTEAMQRLIRFQRQTLALKNTPSIDSALDTMESLLIEVMDFAYVSLQYRSETGVFSPLRQICPDNIHLDYPLMEWVMGTQEVSVLPIDITVDEVRLRSLLFLPFGTHHIMLLWLEQETEAFTQEQEALLSILSREMAAVLDSHHYRLRLEKTRAAMSDIIESVPLGLLAVDHHDTVQMINSTAEIALDVRRRDAVGNNYHDALPKKAAELIDHLEQSDSAEEAELSLGKPGRESQYLGLTISPMRSEDGSSKSGLVVVCRDLQLSREVQKLRELDSMKNDFLSLVTHELRTPLTSIMAYSETLLLDDSQAVPQEWREYIDIIHSEGKRLCRLIDDVLDLTRMEAGKMSYTYEEQDVNETIGVVVMSMTQAFEEKKVDLELELDENTGECRMDVTRFTQVLTSIISNAIKFTAAGGMVTIASRRTEPFAGTPAPTILVSVKDTGIGLSRENLERVFSKFEMVESVKHHTSGTGLSMAISKQIVEEGHHGKIWLESEQGKGTTVYIRIPAS
ncbi:MAG: cell wall metabolism sensor histidine kinase WalK [Planctomycetaceae bacterium]|nr:cell wall metabolism sensor histidine kinase WalK [Planctomycetaceae bacterium]